MKRNSQVKEAHSRVHKRLHQLSSSSSLLWVRASISEEQFRWWKRHAELPKRPDVGTKQIVPGEEPSGLVWIRVGSGEYTPCIRLILDPENTYDAREVYLRSLTKRDPFASPHVVFRGLRNTFQVIEFLKDFGPLEMPRPNTVRELRTLHGGGHRLLDLREFWQRQKKYRAVVELWDAFPDTEHLAAALRKGGSFFEESYREAVRMRLALAEAGNTERRPGVAAGAEPPIDEWLAHASARDIRRLSVDVVTTELKDSAAGQASWLAESREGGKVAFRLVIEPQSLWGAMWEFFAHDTYDGIAWRICPHCGKVFYPGRKDRFYCTPRLQQLHSKREWWNRNKRKISERN